MDLRPPQNTETDLPDDDYEQWKQAEIQAGLKNDLANIRQDIGYFTQYFKMDSLSTALKFAQYSAGLKDNSFHAE